MNSKINQFLLFIVLVLVIIIAVKSKTRSEEFRGGGGGGMKGFSGGVPMGSPPPPGPKPPGPFPPGPPRRGYGGVGWASSGIPAYRYFTDYPLAYSYSYANELNLCNNGCCDFEQCRLGNGCKFTSNDIKYKGQNPDSCIYHKKCVSANVDNLDKNQLEEKCRKESKSNVIN